MGDTVRHDALRLNPLRPEGAEGSLSLLSGSGASLEEWLEDELPLVLQLMKDRHGLLLRGFGTLDPEGLGRIARLLGGETVDYRFGVSPRNKLNRDVYTSTELEKSVTLPLHNELSFAARWPRWILFTCIRPAESGGETPIADVRRVHSSVDPEIRDRFEEQGVLYLRNYGTETSRVNVSWMQSFETDDPQEVEAFCRDSEIEFDWLEGGALRTKRRAPATRRNPQTGELIWFNQAHLFHSSTLDKAVRRGMLARYGAEGLPRNALYGNGERIPSKTIAEIRHAYDLNTLMFEWQRGDVLVLDNMVFAHGRMPFQGERKVLVAMSGPYDPEEPA